ncbi:PREDICTED: uncharacterized protein LOC109129880 [Camelina sativa]|uniref:Uncharacterized protein LOC109129880 n=1 Tax=Camelina sativa TaxID=90675 RepID=A0ABM1R5Z9_CAMSA|nr:PREDICTED: uncharacterized protein LOC109129880 [Camelina sativa]
MAGKFFIVPAIIYARHASPYFTTKTFSTSKVNAPARYEDELLWERHGYTKLQRNNLEGGCEESYTALGKHVGKEKRRKAYSMLEKCMKARSDYFQPFFAMKRDTKERMTTCVCKKVFIAWMDFCKDTKKNNRSCVPTPAMEALVKCMKVDHSDYYHPFLTVFKTTEEHVKNEIKALGS